MSLVASTDISCTQTGSALATFLAGMEGEFDVVETGMSSLEFGLRDLPGRPSILVLGPRLID